MNPSIDIDAYFEPMDHEFGDIDIKPNKQGYRVDKNGIKLSCCYPNLKSVDYFHGDENILYLVEFSDLARQHLCIMERVRNLKECNLNKNDRTRAIRKLHREIGHELKQKYLESLIILRKIPRIFKNVPEWLIVEKGKFIIVVAPSSIDLEEDKKEDIARILEKLKDDLTCSIPDDIFEGVKIVQVNSFFG
ncbi:hypothetical protein [Phytobacter sp. SCO41]|uniref:hypothetical protein n=1 Tax=Phytobacter sp. SCO41 TaxID=1756993 RepID=UPI000D501300|nr:hypothetical protein [Phytobacter sp. SCO41]